MLNRSIILSSLLISRTPIPQAGYGVKLIPLKLLTSCVKLVQILLKTVLFRHTLFAARQLPKASFWKTTLPSPVHTQQLSPGFSTLKLAYLPLLTTKLYTLYTYPITNTSK